MQAFKAAAEVGVHAIETDIHLSSDGVAMLCHVSQFTVPDSGSLENICRVQLANEAVCRIQLSRGVMV